ncbi:MAG: hypothetical protein Q9173_006551 [Seirophora scorigena]
MRATGLSHPRALNLKGTVAGTVPIAYFNSNDDPSKGYAVVETRTVVCWLRVNPHKYTDDEDNDDGGQRVALKQKVIESIPVEALYHSKQGSQYASNHHIEESMHSTIKSSKDD